MQNIRREKNANQYVDCQRHPVGADVLDELKLFQFQHRLPVAALKVRDGCSLGSRRRLQQRLEHVLSMVQRNWKRTVPQEHELQLVDSQAKTSSLPKRTRSA